MQIEQLEGGRYYAECPELEGCHVEGDSIAEVLESIEDVARILIDLSLEHGLPLLPELATLESPPVIRAEVLVQVGS